MAYVILVVVTLFTPLFSSKKTPVNEIRRQKMVEKQIINRGIKDEATISAMRDVKRHLFVPRGMENRAYEDGPLPIGYGQTISQPYIVAYMTELLQLKRSDKVLEIGTGSGYQAAVLGEIVDSVFTVEIIKELGNSAAERLAKEGYDNVHVKVADGYFGWEEEAPFDGIIVTATAGSIPKHLVEQLADGGRMIIPVGGALQVQYLVLVTKKEGTVKTQHLLPVRFVPFTRSHE